MAAGVPTHKLNSTWALWYCPQITKEHLQAHKGQLDVATKSETKCVDNFQTVEEMWATYNSLPPCMKLPPGDFVFYFREGLSPFWEDEGFKKGGRLRFKLDPQPSADKFVAHVLMNILGENISCVVDAANVCGGVRYTRRDKLRDQFVKLEVWITDSEYKATLEKYFKELAKDCGIGNIDQGDNFTYTKF